MAVYLNIVYQSSSQTVRNFKIIGNRILAFADKFTLHSFLLGPFGYFSIPCR